MSERLDRIWAGWRSAYVAAAGSGELVGAGSVFRRIIESGMPDDEAFIVWRGTEVFAILNAYPYTNGHLLLMPYREVAELEDLKDSEADVNFGVMVSTNCRYACYAMRGGNKLAWEESAQITSKFDPQTGTWGLYNGDRPVFQVNMTTGELIVNGRPAVVTYK